MKIAAREIEIFIKKPSPDTCAILLYGPDQGLVREYAATLTANVTKDDFNITEISEKTLADSPTILSDEANSFSMFGGRKVIRLRDITDKSTSAIKSVAPELSAQSNLIVVEGGELSRRSSLRMLFENGKNLAAVACYVEDEKAIARLIVDSLRDAGFKISADAVAHIASNVVGDRGVARSEIAKLITYMGANKNITIEDAQAAIGDSAELSADDIAKFVASGKFAEADRILSYVLEEGTSAVGVLRSMQSYFNRLHLTKARIEQGENMEAAIKKLQPQVFFKLLPSFEAQLCGWSLSQMENALSILISAEAKCKVTASSPEVTCGRALLAISQIGSRIFNRR